MKNVITLKDNKVMLHNFEGIKKSISLRIYPTNQFTMSSYYKDSSCVTVQYTIEDGCIEDQSLYNFFQNIGQGNPLTFVCLSGNFYLLEYKPTPLMIQKFLKEI